MARGYVGVALRDVDPDLRDALNLSAATGAVVQDVTPGSPAERAGLRPYDVIAAVDGQAVSTGDELIAMVSAPPAGRYGDAAADARRPRHLDAGEAGRTAGPRSR